MTEKLAYSLAHAAEAIDVSLSTIRRAIDDNELPAHYIGEKKSTVRISADDLIRWFKSSPTERRT